VGIEPCDSGGGGAKSGEHSDRRVAVTGENDGKPARFERFAHRAREHPHQLEARLDLRVPRITSQLRDFSVYAVTVLAECALQSSFEKSLRTRTHARAVISGIVGDRQQLKVHRGKTSA